jgi:carboxypeptidase C (cathepsin A)
MGLTADAHKNISRSQFPAGHMVYIDDASMRKLKGDVDAFYDGMAGR